MPRLAAEVILSILFILSKFPRRVPTLTLNSLAFSMPP